jgi:16S rRNA (guanine966-N2)-methyltransferase
MRIIGGTYKSRVLAEFTGDDVRPTSDRAKEALFNILSWNVMGARVLDLFAGSGSLGLESLSRGAAEVTFNDAAKTSVAIIKKNLAALKLPVDGKKIRVSNLDFSLCLQAQTTPYDIIFIDPPYKLDIGLRALELIGQKRLLTEKGVAVYERDRAFDGEIDGLEKFDERKYGKAYLTFFRLK